MLAYLFITNEAETIMKRKNPAEQTAGQCLESFIFSLCCHSAPDMAFLFIDIQNLPHLQIQGVVVLLQPVGKILMYRGFGDAEVPGSRADSGTGFDHVHSQLAGPFLQ